MDVDSSKEAKLNDSEDSKLESNGKQFIKPCYEYVLFKIISKTGRLIYVSV